MIAFANQEDAFVKQILDTLETKYKPSHPKASIDAYRYNPASIRVRIIDPEFSGKLITERDAQIWKLLRENLPKNVFADVGLVLLLAPKEAKTSMMNIEFEDPSPLPPD